jgi:hypothetical protein
LNDLKFSSIIYPGYSLSIPSSPSDPSPLFSVLLYNPRCSPLYRSHGPVSLTLWLLGGLVNFGIWKTSEGGRKEARESNIQKMLAHDVFLRTMVHYSGTNISALLPSFWIFFCMYINKLSSLKASQIRIYSKTCLPIGCCSFLWERNRVRQGARDRVLEGQVRM